MSTITTPIEITTSEPEHADAGYWNYDMEIIVGEQTYKIECWKLATFLERGADQDLDGSGLELLGNSQPGGWRCLNSDGQARGNPSPYSFTEDGRIEVSNSNDCVHIHVPEGEDPQAFFDALEKAIDSAVDEADVDEPDAEAVFEELGGACEVDDHPWLRVGQPFASRQVYCVCEDDENGEFVMEDISSDEEIPNRVKEIAAAKFAELFTRAYNSSLGI